jgi:predicted ATP-dependent Lon-type protease
VVKLIDLITARLDARTESYLATLPSVQLRDVCLDDQLVKEHERMLTGGFYAEVDLAYDAVIAQEKNGRLFAIAALRPIQLSYARASEFVGDRNAREHEFSLQLRAFDTPKSGQSLGVAALLALCSVLIGKSLQGRLVVVGGLNLGGSIDPLYHAVGVVELAIEKGAAVVLIPVSARKQLFDLSDDMAAKVNVLFYTDARDAFIKAVAD